MIQLKNKFYYLVRDEIEKDTELTIDYNTLPWRP